MLQGRTALYPRRQLHCLHQYRTEIRVEATAELEKAPIEELIEQHVVPFGQQFHIKQNTLRIHLFILDNYPWFLVHMLEYL